MKKRSNVYFVIGTFLIVLNLLTDIVNIKELSLEAARNNSFSIGYLIGSHFLLIIGVILIMRGAKLRRKIKTSEIDKQIDEIGEQQKG